MKTWRERIQEAKERGFFTREDQLAWLDTKTCPAGELVQSYPSLNQVQDGVYNRTLHFMGGEFGRYFLYDRNTADQASDFLDTMEDKALELKRGHTNA